jgi:hypothetical protein
MPFVEHHLIPQLFFDPSSPRGGITAGLLLGLQARTANATVTFS